jgi:hypothetical protein
MPNRGLDNNGIIDIATKSSLLNLGDACSQAGVVNAAEKGLTTPAAS